MNYELHLISKIMRSNDPIMSMNQVLEEIRNRELFLVSNLEFSFLREGYELFNKVPNEKTFCEKFSSIVLPDTPETLQYYLTEVIKSYVFFEMANINQEIVELMKDGKPFDAMELAKDKISNIYGISNLAQDIDIVKDVNNRVDKYDKRRNKGIVTGIPTGWSKLDRETTGFQKKELTFVVGRMQSFKCVYENSFVRTLNGELITLKEFKNRGEQFINSFDENTGKIVISKVNNIIDTGMKKGYKVTTLTGKETIVSNIHPYYTDTGWKPLKYIKVGNRIALPKKLNINKKILSVEYDKAYFLGLMIAKGSISRGEPVFSTGDNDIVKWAKNFAYKNNLMLNKINSYDYIFVKSNNSKEKNVAIQWINDFMLNGCSSKDKCIPVLAMCWDTVSKSILIKALFDCGGSIEKNCSEISYTSLSKKLIDQIVSILLEFNIFSSVKFYSNNYGGFWKITVHGNEINTFISNIPKLIQSKSKNLVKRNFRELKNFIYLPKDLLLVFKRAFKNYRNKNFINFIKLRCKKISFSSFYDGKKGICKDQLFKYVYLFFSAKVISKNELIKFMYYVDREIYMDEIISIESVGKVKMLDLEIDGTHNFIVDNTIVHNTWVMLSWAIHAWKSGYDILLFSREMGYDQIVRRIDTFLTQTRFKDIKTGTLSDEQFYIFEKKMLEMYKKDNSFIIIDSAGNKEYDMSFIRSKIRRYKPSVIFIDGVYLLSGKGKAEWEKQTYITRSLKQITIDDNVPIVGTTQANRSSSKMIQLTGMSYSDSYGQDADNVIALNRVYDKSESIYTNDVVVDFIKMRDAENIKMKISVNLDDMNISEEFSNVSLNGNEIFSEKEEAESLLI